MHSLRYVQFSEYGSFVRAMDEFRGMKLVRKEVDKNVAVNIQVTFDKTKHLSDASVKRRKGISRINNAILRLILK